MNTKTIRTISVAFLTLSCMLFFGLSARVAHAQNDEAEGPKLIAVLDVPGGGTEDLVAAISEIDNVEVQGQTWFLEQIKSGAFKAKGIMSRPEDIKWLMDGAKITYILYLAPGEDATSPYTARLVGAEAGKPVHDFEVERTADKGVTKPSAKIAAIEIDKYIESQKPRDLEAEAAAAAAKKKAEAERAAAEDPNEVKKKVAAEKKKALDAFSRDWLSLNLRGIGVRRDFHVTGANEAVSAYSSAFYPGFALDIAAFPMGMSTPEYAGIGFYADFMMGFDSVIIADGAGNEQNISITQLELEGGVLYRLGDPLQLRSSDAARVDLSIGVHHSNYAATPNIRLPSLSHTSFVVGSRVSRKMFSDSFKLRAGVNISPIGIFGTGVELFGESAYTYGVGGSLGGEVTATDDIGITFGYKFHLQRTNFTGEGELGFTDATAFELVQDLSAGIAYTY